MDESKFSIPSASEKQSYKYLLDAALARKRAKERGADQGIQEEFTDELIAAAPEEAPDALSEEKALEEASEEAIEELEESEAKEALAEAESPTEIRLQADKNYFRIGEVADLLKVEPHVLRYWESEFSQIRPTKSGGQRVYNRKTVECLIEIRHLLYEQGFSISGARKKLKQGRAAAKSQPAVVAPAPGASREELLELEKGLKDLIRFAESNTAF